MRRRGRSSARTQGVGSLAWLWCSDATCETCGDKCGVLLRVVARSEEQVNSMDTARAPPATGVHPGAGLRLAGNGGAGGTGSKAGAIPVG